MTARERRRLRRAGLQRITTEQRTARWTNRHMAVLAERERIAAFMGGIHEAVKHRRIMRAVEKRERRKQARLA